MEDWSNVADDPGGYRTTNVVYSQTGYHAESLTEMFRSGKPYFSKYKDGNGNFVSRTREKWRAQHYFYLLFMYIHLYGAATVDRLQDICRTARLKDGKAITAAVWYKIILPAAKEWSLHIDFIRWSDRLRYDNHHPFFPKLFTTIWDTTCIRICKPGAWTVARYTCNGHYDFPCYLILLGITFTGHLVFYSGLHRSTAYDSHIFQDTDHLHPRFQNEMSIGDVHFRNCRNFATPPVKPPGGHLTTADLVFLQYIQLVRSRIETHNTVFKRHGMFKIGTVFRGHVTNLAAFVKISAHGTAVELRVRERMGNMRHEGYGWWSHF